MQNRILIGAIAIITILYWMILLFKINLFQKIPDFFWHFMNYTDKSLSLLWLIVPLAILLYFVISYLLKNHENHKRNLLLIIIMGYIIQMGFGYMEGRGIDGIRQRMVTTGHSEFVKIAAMAPDMKKVAMNYESTIGKTEELKFVQTKPPGHLLFYVFTFEVASIFKEDSDPEQNFITLVTFSAYIYPLLTYLVIIPLFYISRIFLKAGAAYLPCILYLFIPSVTLVTLHLDQVLYPLLFISGLLLILNGCKKDKMILSILSGVFIYFALYFSFSLLPIIPLGLMFGASYIYSDLASDNKIKSLGRFVAGLIIGWISAHLLFWFLLDYNVFVRYQNAMAFHQAWKQWESSLSNIALYGFVNYIEFVCWMGLPISILFFAGSHKKFTELIKKQFNLSNLLFAVVILIFLLLGIFGKTKSEVGRLWIFMIPIVLLFVSTELQDRFKDKLKPALWFILSFQLITILFIKRFQDFW
ncbi:MAG: hypothetical protein GY865_13065 [candidate division Zixibacteria bacterium]|nr:hypothetical protein [candidate division Zixibacteria bacterium]